MQIPRVVLILAMLSDVDGIHAHKSLPTEKL